MTHNKGKLIKKEGTGEFISAVPLTSKNYEEFLEVPIRKNIRCTTAIARFVFICVMASVLLSCNTKIDISPKFLFSLPLGNLPGEFKHWSTDLSSKMNNVLSFNKGIFYIGNGDRMLIVSSNGYLLDFIANDTMLVAQEQNFSTKLEQDRVTGLYGDNTPYIGYPLYMVNNIAVDNSGRVLMTNVTFRPGEQLTSLYENKQSNIAYLLVYNEEKHLYNMLRDGEHKSFESAVGLFAKRNNDIVLVSKKQQSHQIYVLDKEGNTKSTIQLPYGQYPKLLMDSIENRIEDDEYFALVNAVVPSVTHNYIYVQFFYYKIEQNSTKDAILSLPFLESRIFRINLASETYDKSITLPFSQDNTLYLHSVLSDETLVFFSYLDDNESVSLSEKMTTQIYFIAPNGTLIKKYNLQYPDIDFFDLEFAVDEQGNIGAFFLLKDRLELYMWR